MNTVSDDWLKFATTPIYKFTLKVFDTRESFSLDSYTKQDAFNCLQYIAKLHHIDIKKYFVRYFKDMRTWVLYKTSDMMINDI